MKAVSKLVVLSLAVLLPLAASAKSPEAAYVEAAPKASNVPAPIAVVSPRVSAEHAGSTVELAFTVSAAGKPTGLTVVSSPDAMLAETVMDAVKKWRFRPATENGSAVAKNVRLPVRIVNTEVRFAAN